MMSEQKELADASRVSAIRGHLREWEQEGALDTGKRYALQLLALIDAWAGRAAQMSWIKQVGTVQIRRINEDAGHDHKPNLLVFDLAPYAPQEPKSD